MFSLLFERLQWLQYLPLFSVRSLPHSPVSVLVPPVVEVPEPPFNSPLQEKVANQQIAFPCPATGTTQ